MTDSPVLFTNVGRTAVITLNRPEALNAVNDALAAGVNAAWARLEEDPDLDVAIVTGAGDRAFCAGADLKEVATTFNQSEGHHSSHDAPSFPMSPREHQVTKPIICAVNGVCVGAGIGFVLESDLAIAAETASFIDPHPRWGGVNGDILEEWGRLPLSTTFRLVFGGSGERLSAKEAYQRGFVGELVPRERLLERALEIAALIQMAPQAAVRAQKEAIWRGYDAILAPGLSLARQIRMGFRQAGGRQLLAQRTRSFTSASDSGAR